MVIHFDPKRAPESGRECEFDALTLIRSAMEGMGRLSDRTVLLQVDAILQFAKNANDANVNKYHPITTEL